MPLEPSPKVSHRVWSIWGYRAVSATLAQPAILPIVFHSKGDMQSWLVTAGVMPYEALTFGFGSQTELKAFDAGSQSALHGKLAW